ncbi:uncharacterized protein BJ212DRAFT_1486737 [Suillus subaureus]|uniref:Uncharacterized protein n=1 Tax=Suillus subaureus TaxID=48587 RepID=A0A9P7J5M2_9AGAM|nr:uncharacterized protein BJ212DRAFT_1486737 [Suillus subaureus]KAG1804316.1 hypothetical protein BJ212DRAFT_1486737 [Suillus subaureus]
MMKEWMQFILKPYAKYVIEENELLDDQKSILLLDCYPVKARNLDVMMGETNDKNSSELLWT